MDPILRIGDVVATVGLSKRTIWRRIQAGEFPRPVRLGGATARAVGWRCSDVEQWMAERQTA